MVFPVLKYQKCCVHFDKIRRAACRNKRRCIQESFSDIAPPMKACQKMKSKSKKNKEKTQEYWRISRLFDEVILFFRQVLVARFYWGSNIYAVDGE